MVKLVRGNDKMDAIQKLRPKTARGIWLVAALFAIVCVAGASHKPPPFFGPLRWFFSGPCPGRGGRMENAAGFPGGFVRLSVSQGCGAKGTEKRACGQTGRVGPAFAIYVGEHDVHFARPPPRNALHEVVGIGRERGEASGAY